MLEPGNASGAFLQTPTPILDKIPGLMDARFLSSVGLGFGIRIGRSTTLPNTLTGQKLISHHLSGTEKQPKHEVFGRDIPRTSGRIPGWTSRPKKLSPLHSGAQENKAFCADVLDPKARTSMIRGGLRKTFPWLKSAKKLLNRLKSANVG